MDTETAGGREERDGARGGREDEEGSVSLPGRKNRRREDDTATLIREILHILRLVVRSDDGTSGSSTLPHLHILAVPRII